MSIGKEQKVVCSGPESGGLIVEVETALLLKWNLERGDGGG